MSLKIASEIALEKLPKNCPKKTALKSGLKKC
jgi:hypothetical protein